MTFCPAICRMPYFGEESRHAGRLTSRSTRSKTGLVAQLRQIHRELAEGLLRRAATQENEFGFRLAAARDRRSFAFRLLARHGGRQDGWAVCDGPESGGGRAEFGRLERKALAKLKWLVVRDMVETETASFLV